MAPKSEVMGQFGGQKLTLWARDLWFNNGKERNNLCGCVILH